MRTPIYTLVLVLLFGAQINDLCAQWTSTGENTIPADHRIWSIKVAPDGSVWAAASYDALPPTGQIPKVLRSITEGDSWETSNIPEAISNHAWDIAPINEDKAFVALDQGGLYQTTDGGESWIPVADYPYTCWVVHFFDENDGFALGLDDADQRVFSVTDNGGTDWLHFGGADWTEPSGTSLPDFDPNEVVPAFAYSTNSAYDYTDQAIIMGSLTGGYWLSTDRGYNWTRHESELSGIGSGIAATNVAMKDEMTFMLAGDYFSNGNSIVPINVATTDGGLTWVQGNSGLTTAASHYIPGTDSVFVMVGHAEFGFGTEGTKISYNLGMDWQELDNTSIIALDFLDATTGYGGCCNNSWATANGQIHKWNLDVTSAGEEATGTVLQLMPNPVADDLKVSIQNGFQSQELLLEIFSPDGRRIIAQRTANLSILSIDVDFLPPGLYTLRIRGDRQQAISKFVKE